MVAAWWLAVGGIMSTENELQKAERAVASAEAAVSAAQSIVSDLEVKRAAAVQRGTELADERSAIAFQAHTTNDEAAAKRLQELHQAIAVHGSELASLDAAIRAAGERVEAAQAAVALEMQKLNASKLCHVSRTFFAQCKKIDQALDDMVNALYDIEPIRQQFDALGVGPSSEQFRVLGERPILLALADTDFEGRIGRHLAPNERMTFTQLAEAWSRQHRATVARILGEEQETEAA
jgi:hypothetical protein